MAVPQNEIRGDRYPVLHKLAVEYSDKDNEKSLTFAQQAGDAALISGDSLWIVKSIRLKGQILSKLERLPECYEELESALAISERQKATEEYIVLTNLLATHYLFQSQFDKALELYFKAHDLAIQENDTLNVKMSLNNIGMTYYKLRDYERGLRFLKRGLAIEKSIGQLSVGTLLNISLCYAFLMDFSNARSYLNESLEVCGSACPDQFKTHLNYASGVICLGLNQARKAEAAFLESYSYAKKMDDARMQLDNIYYLAEINIDKKQLMKAMKYLEEGEDIVSAGVPFNLEMIKIFSQFSELYLAMKNYERGSFYQSKYISLKDSIYNDVRTTNLMKTEAAYLERENNIKIAAQKEIIALKEEVIRRQTNLNIAISFLGLMTLICLIFIFRNFRRKRNLNILLEKKVKERTIALELSESMLVNAVREKNFRMSLASNAIAESVSTIEGLCLNGIKELSDPFSRSYLEKIKKTAVGLMGNLHEALQVGVENR